MLSESQQAADTLLRDAVLAKLATEPALAGLELKIGVLNGIVHLAGEAGSLKTWKLAGHLASEISGVRAVVNRIAAPGAPPPSRSIHLDLSG